MHACTHQHLEQHSISSLFMVVHHMWEGDLGPLTCAARACAGKAQEELLLLQEAPAARPPATPAQHAPRAPAAVYMLSDGRGGATPMAAFPVQCPDGRVVYHLYPTTPRAVRPFHHTPLHPLFHSRPPADALAC